MLNIHGAVLEVVCVIARELGLDMFDATACRHGFGCCRHLSMKIGYKHCNYTLVKPGSVPLVEFRRNIHIGESDYWHCKRSLSELRRGTYCQHFPVNKLTITRDFQLFLCQRFTGKDYYIEGRERYNFPKDNS